MLGHPEVEDVACLGIPDEWSGERPKAYIVVAADRKGDEKGVGERLIKYVREKKVRHKWVTEVELVDEIPKSGSGKILRRILRDMAKSGKSGVVVKEEQRERAKL